MLSAEAVKYLPTGQVVFFGAHDVAALIPILKCVDAHGVHVASAALSVEAVKYWPAGQVVFLGVQVKPA